MAGLAIPWQDQADPLPEDRFMPEHEVCTYSRKYIEEAGKMLAGQIDSYDEEVVEMFRIAHLWRRSHLRPMQMVRADLAGKARRLGGGTISVSRLKRMLSIRRKLRETPRTLYQMQDIGGCRGIFGTLADVELVARQYLDGQAKYAVSRADNYIADPKPDGYRCQHIILKFSGLGEDAAYNRHRIEVQLRTRLQHAWATAVEAVGLVTNSNMKAGEGDTDWLRLFQLVSAEFALTEGAPLVPMVSESRRERLQEIRHIARKLKAVENLSAYARMIRGSESLVRRGARFYLIQYDYDERSVTVRPQFEDLRSSAAYEEAEQSQSQKNTVFVEVDRLEDLKSAFPNYFLDVRDFTARLQSLVTGQQAFAPESLSWVRSYKKPRPGV